LYFLVFLILVNYSSMNDINTIIYFIINYYIVFNYNIFIKLKKNKITYSFSLVK
jgi:hypothetical protein